MRHKQPAQPGYFFAKGSIELGHVIKDSFKNIGSVIKKCLPEFTKMKNKWATHGFFALVSTIPNVFMIAFWLSAFLISIIVTPLACLTISIFQVVILFVGYIVVFIIYLIIALFDRIYCILHAITTDCPNCQRRFILPIYTCTCGIKHDRLLPGYYGIFKRICNCGQKLSTTFWNGREKLSASCPNCTHQLKDGGLNASWCIPVVGSPSSGKTCYINMTMMTFESLALPKYGLSYTYENNGLDEFQKISARLKSCQVPVKTADNRLRYYQFSLTPPGEKKQLVSLCDVAGELFDVSISGDKINEQIGFRYANAFLLLIDPLAITKFRNEISNTNNLNGYNGSTQPIDELVTILIDTLQKMLSIKSNAFLDSNVAVVFTKIDMPGLDEIIGEKAVLRNITSTDSKTRLKAQNDLCDQFLRKYDEDNFIKILSQFKNVQYFTCSALGHVDNGQPFNATKVEEPLLWLLSKTSKVIEKTIKF